MKYTLIEAKYFKYRLYFIEFHDIPLYFLKTINIATAMVLQWSNAFR